MSPISNPYRAGSNLGADVPASLPALPFDNKPTSDLGKQAVSLYRDAQAATERIREVREASSAAAAKLTATRAALQAEVVRGAQEGLDQEREQELSLELAAAERLADGNVFQLRHRTAIQAQRDAVQAYTVHVWDHFLDLLDAELRDEAEAASAELVEALGTIAPVKERYEAIQRRVWELARITAVGEHGQHWAQVLALAAEPAPPLPSDEGLATFERARTAPATVEADDDELVTINAD